MNIFLVILLVLAGLIALLLIIGLFSKKDYAIQREIVINKPKGEVFNYIKYLRNQDNFNKWVMVDPNMKKEFKGTDGTPGFVYGWNGDKKAGEGEQEIKNVREGERVDMEIRFVRPFVSVAQAHIITDAATSNQTKLKWGFNSQMKYPMNVMLLFMSMDKLLGKDMEASLGNLKTILEK